MKHSFEFAVAHFKKYTRKNLFRKYFFRLFIMITIPFLIILASLYYFQQKNIDSEIYSFANMTFEKSSLQTERIFSELINTASLYGNDSSVQVFLHTAKKELAKQDSQIYEKIYTQMRRSINTSSVLADIQIYSFQSQYVLSLNTGGGYIADFPAQSWQRCYNETGYSNFVVYTENFYGTAKSLYLSHGLYTNFGLSGLIIYELDLDDLDTFLLSKLAADENGFLLLDVDSSVLYSTAREYELDSDAVTALKHITAGGKTSYKSGDKLYFSKALDTAYPITLMYLYDLSKTTHNFVFSNLLLLLCICITVIMPLVIALVVSSDFYNSIMEIAAALNTDDVEGNTEMNEIARICNQIGVLLDKNKNMETELLNRVSAFKHAQAIALQTQLNPHFLFNTLNLIILNAKVLTKGSNPVSTMVTLLSDLLSFSLNTQNYFVSIEEEIYYAKLYLQIQQIKYKNNFDCIWEVDEAVLQMKTIKMILQPLLENAFAHGISALEGVRGRITVSITQENECIHICVADNGAGIPKERLEEIRRHLQHEDLPRKNHIGLANVNQRIKLIYGDDYRISVVSGQNGTKIHLIFPAEHNK